MSRLGTESAFEVLAHARRLEAEGRSIIHLEIGEPDFATPQNIIDAAVRALNDGATHYTPASGIPQVREATAQYVTKHTGVPTTMENIVLTPGSKNILLFALLMLVEEGDEVIVPDPGYPIYRSLVEFIGAKAVSLPVRQENAFRIDPAELRSLVTDRTRLLIVNSPGNPTGGVLTREDCEQIAEIAQQRDLVVLSDEIYNRLVYDGAHTSLYSIDGMAERTIYLDGLSKAWAMCGWRLGIGAMPVELAKRMDTLMINSSSCAAAFTQWAAVEAFDSPESDAAVDTMVHEFHRRRDILVDALKRIPGIECHQPEGAFYVFPDITATGWEDRDLANALLDEVGVAVLRGSSFGPHGAGHIRLSYANSVENLMLATDRIATFLGAAVSQS
ncbi:MAG: pyridoxal phosphate-dependent aminotransferase [Candidatus Dormibacteraeota bacterium]|nr:pyridoxal phosphate-dependent aminotransferase [Candidatus Dormibacteraeota bacterium]MBV9526118.1 pyridoxal phosphate-dependent aminotransferase [Candidatus Dormibacteraeota bacterium]